MNPSLISSLETLQALKKRYPGFSFFNELQEEHGLARFAKLKPANNATSGRLGKPGSFYRRVAKIYAQARQQNSRHPIQDVALVMDFDSDSKARDAVYRARKMGFLPKTRRGRAWS